MNGRERERERESEQVGALLEGGVCKHSQRVQASEGESGSKSKVSV